MRILFVYHDYFKRRKRYGYILHSLGHSVKYVDVLSKTQGKPVELRHLEDVDFVLAINSAYAHFGILSEEFFAECAAKNIPVACYSTCLCEKTIRQTVKIAKPFSWVFEHTPQVVRLMKEADPKYAEKYHVLPHGFHPEQFFPNDLPKRYDVSFGGHPQQRNMKRREMLAAACDQFDVTVFGKALCQRLGRPKREYRTTTQERQIYNHSRVCLNLPFYDSTQGFLRAINAPNDRFFETSACGSIQLTGWDDDLAQMLEPDKECFYYKNTQDMLGLLDMILDNYERLCHVGERARIRCMTDHTYRHRIERMMRIVRG